MKLFRSSVGLWSSNGTRPTPVSSAVHASAIADSKAASPSAKGAWSDRLLAVAQSKAAKEQPIVDIFTPARTNLNTADDDVDEEEGSGFTPEQKRIPAEMRCFDTARVYIRGGDGGNGCVAFRREKFVEWGGPAGGNGGTGGNVWAVADTTLNSLSSFRQKIHWKAEHGVNGTGKQMNGADAQDLYIPVPPGTIIRLKGAEEGQAPLAELLHPGEKALIMVGGRGGRGNFSFKTAKNKAPTIAEKGELGKEAWVDLELKVVADAGIIGVPNAGKSTLLSVVTAAKPKIANYPFTTLVPNLGVCEMDYRTTVFADVPGLLEGAHEGLGLGHEFLRHVQRCRVLVHVIDGTSPDPVGDFKAINLELELFNPELKDKPQVVAYNKVDLPDSGDYWEFVKETLTQDLGVPEDCLFPVSAATGQGVLNVVRKVRAVLDGMGPAEVVYETNATNATKPPPRQDVRIDQFTVSVEEDGSAVLYVVEGEAIEKFAQMTNWDYYEAVSRFQRVLEVSGISSALRAKGVKEGDTVVLGDTEFTWSNAQTNSAVYSSWLKDMKARGVNRQGLARWPHPDLRD